eukprot:TRINITY_DN76318_c0_g1_i1.p1 TRINITY_DN76318_c0_g1~~TRINITY_DN76318_c0_g1_i1.p1  ORF type:complete len:311 (-),score=37.22 TRINITY_DN76318_c0_g1_i1:16-948(-)
MLLRPHIVRDLRILSRVLQISSGKDGSVQQACGDKLLADVLARTSDLAAFAIAALCREMGGSTSSASSFADEVPQLDVFQSTLGHPNGTLGVRLLSDIPAGRFVCFYPGRIVVPASSQGERELPKSDKILANEYEGVYIDGKGWLAASLRGHPALGGSGSVDVGGFSDRTLWHGNRLALGNLINHPPRGSFPNCIPMAFHWPTWQDVGEETPARWARLVPHVVVQSGKIVRTASGETVGEGVEKVWFPPWPHMGFGFFSVRAVRSGEELFWNYRLTARGGAASYPRWYAPVDEEEFEQAVAFKDKTKLQH